MRIALQASVLALGLGLMVGCESTKRSQPQPQPQPDIIIVNSPSENHDHQAEPPNRQPGPPDHAPAHGWRRQHQYVYYPSHEVYYAPEERKYFWIEGGSWRVGVQLPDRIRIDTREGVRIEIGDDTPYSYHESKHGKIDGHDSGRGNNGNAYGHDKDNDHDNGRGKSKDKGKGKNKHH